MIILFTGNGKGKTTAALGQAIRAIGQGKKVLMIQFIKGSWKTGEDLFLKKFKSLSLRETSRREENSLLTGDLPKGGKFKIIKGGRGFVGIAGDKLPLSIHQKAAQKTWKLVKKSILSKKYDLVILDEINVAIKLKLLSEKEVLKFLRKLPKNIDLILTGRGASKNLIKISDIATEMKEIKYPKGIGGYVPKKGIEF